MDSLSQRYLRLPSGRGRGVAPLSTDVATHSHILTTQPSPAASPGLAFFRLLIAVVRGARKGEKMNGDVGMTK